MYTNGLFLDESFFYLAKDSETGKQRFKAWCKKCVYINHRKWARKNKKKVNLYNKSRRDDNKEKFILSEIKNRAKSNGLEFDLEIEDIIIPNLCPILGIEIDKTNQKRMDNSPSIDRIDNSRGYTKDNIIIISWRANNIKSDATIEELIKIANFYKCFIKEKSV